MSGVLVGRCAIKILWGSALPGTELLSNVMASAAQLVMCNFFNVRQGSTNASQDRSWQWCPGVCVYPEPWHLAKLQLARAHRRGAAMGEPGPQLSLLVMQGQYIPM